MTEVARMIIYFMDGTKLAVEYPKATAESGNLAMNVRKALDQDKITMEVDGDLMVIPVRSIKYIQVRPAPDELPQGVLMNAKIIS